MIVFNLACESDHLFEGWFGSADDFALQRERGLLCCPVCGTDKIEKRLSAPRLNLLGDPAPAAAHRGTAEGAVAMIGPEQQQLRDLIRKVMDGAEDVGARFAEEARRIHYKEAPARSIRGLASHEEAKALIEEGVEVTQLPFAQTDKSRLN